MDFVVDYPSYTSFLSISFNLILDLLMGMLDYAISLMFWFGMLCDGLE